ncbi:MAG: TVP38/TMEM64 family protein [Pseudomonadales bacterium]
MSTNPIHETVFGVPIYRWALLGALLVLMLVFSVYSRKHLGIEWNMDSLRLFIQSLGAWGPLSYIAILVFRFLFLIPSGLLLIAAGIFFGPFYGAAYAGVGLFGSALWKYAMVSVVGRDVVVRQLPSQLQLWLANKAQGTTSFWALLGICAYPFIPKHVFQFAAIFAGMKLATYAVAVSTGSFARAAMFASLGEALYSGVGLTTLAGILIIVIGAPLCVSQWRQQLLTPLQPFISSTKSGSKP